MSANTVTNTDYNGTPFDVDALTKHLESALEKKDSKWHAMYGTQILSTLKAKDIVKQSTTPNQYHSNFQNYESLVNYLLNKK